MNQANGGRGIGRGAAWTLLLLWGGLLTNGAVFAQGAAGQPAAGGAAALFEKQCYSCHNIGGGAKKGPDLQGVTTRRTREWLHRFIASPSSLKKAGDADAVALFAEFAPEEMPDQMLSAAQVDEILALIETLTSGNKTFVPQSGQLTRQPTGRDIYPGYQLFTGQRKLQNGAPACISCHTVADSGLLGGGTLGLDLTQANLKYTDIELASILKAPAFPVMSKVFLNHDLTDEEIIQLFAYLQHARTRTPDPVRPSLHFLGLGLAGMLAGIGLMSFAWRRRLRGVRRPLLARARRGR